MKFIGYRTYAVDVWDIRIFVFTYVLDVFDDHSVLKIQQNLR